MAMQFLRKLLFSYYVRIFPFSQQPSKCPQVYLCRIHDNSVSKVSQEGKCVSLCDEVKHQKAISQKVSPQLLCEDIYFFTWAPWAPKYHFTVSTTTVLANSSKKGTLELCLMKSHIRKQSLRNLLSSFYVKIFPFSLGHLWAQKYHFANSTKRVLANCLLASML